MYCAPGWSGGWHWGVGLFPGLLILTLLGFGIWLLVRRRPGSATVRGLCPHCSGEILPVFFRCPHCGETLKRNCPACSRVIEHGWTFCPYCSQSLKQQPEVEPAST